MEEPLTWDDFATLMSMPTEEEDIKTVWKILDSEKKGTMHACVVSCRVVSCRVVGRVWC